MRRVRYGMVGGGTGAFIGTVHRMAAALDGELELVAGAFASTAERSRETGAELGLDPERVYGSFEEMADAEAARPDDERIEVVSIVTPNHVHHPAARAFLDRGFHVVCDKPLTTTVEDAEELCRLAAERDRLFCVTYNYTGYPMVKEARERVRGGELGPVRKVVVEYSQGWLSTLLEAEGNKQAEWRTDPRRGGPSSVLGDIGSHAHDLVRYVTGLEIARLFADLGTVVDGRRVDDDATVLLELEGGVRGLLIASQISAGERNHLRLRVYGVEGGVDWRQEDPNDLRLLAADGSERVLHTGTDGLSARARAATRIPGGHPEGFIEAFANLYRNVARSVRAWGESADDRSGLPPFTDDFRTVADGAHGVRFIHAAVESERAGRWIDCAYAPPA
ncbi:MAG TPA: Gfo/Idh/MocA family oxidoreductase [Longimicrobiales bacterium]|nr:Gfo/Idh/MocA family oxidoreductase [Longimicrobiales bacterium]